jgi:hypothetical protein
MKLASRRIAPREVYGEAVWVNGERVRPSLEDYLGGLVVSSVVFFNTCASTYHTSV